IDTARTYGTSEEIIGKVLKHRRQEYLLATKISPFQIFDLDAAALMAHIEKSVEASLRMLQTDSIDLLMLHSAPVEVLERVALFRETIQKLKQKGYIRYFGASVYEDAGTEALQRNDFECLQIAYSALDRRPEKALLPEAERKGVGLV